MVRTPGKGPALAAVAPERTTPRPGTGSASASRPVFRPTPDAAFPALLVDGGAEAAAPPGRSARFPEPSKPLIGSAPFPTEAGPIAALPAGVPAPHGIENVPAPPGRKTSPPPRTVEVTIGRIEVRAERPAAPAPPVAPVPERRSVPSLDDYLARRRDGR